MTLSDTARRHLAEARAQLRVITERLADGDEALDTVAFATLVGAASRLHQSFVDAFGSVEHERALAERV